MPEPFKTFFNARGIAAMAAHLQRIDPAFDGAGFAAFATDGLDARELKQRAGRITDGLEKYLPEDFTEAVDLLLAALAPEEHLDDEVNAAGVSDFGIRGWLVMPMADYIARRGLDQVVLSLDALKTMTPRFSSEFAIRPFLDRHPQITLKTMAKWTRSENEHVRRLVSEGSRPRLPWGLQLRAFVKNPEPVLPLLEALKDDPSEYVRRSVANHLNDISKDHPDLVADLARQWLEDPSGKRRRLVRHGLRTLIKAGHTGALQALGFGPAKVALRKFMLTSDEIIFGDALEFEMEFLSRSQSDQPLVIDFVIHHMRANGKTSPKVFKWKTITLPGGKAFCGSKRHRFKPITTRQYYSGRHRVEVVINGEVICGAEFMLTVP